MNNLQLVQRLRRKCRVIGANPATIEGVTLNEELARLIDWTNEAWVSIQNERADWRWMRKSAQFQTVAGQPSYTIAQIGLTDFGNWDRETFRTYNTLAGKSGEIQLDYIDYDTWRNQYQFSGFRDARTMPVQFTWLPDDSVGLGPTPTDGYTVTGDYFAIATEMTKNIDVPGLPAQYHMAIVYRAMMFYGASEAASEVYNEGEAEYKKLMYQVRRRELPEITMGGALA